MSIMKNRILQLFLIAGTAAACSLFSGCALVDPDTSILAPHKWDEIFRNRENLAKLRVKMTKEEVLKVMGEPVKGEVYCEDNIWWYYTRTCWSDFMTTRDECTPLVFDEEGRLKGWGISYFRKHHDFVSWNEKAVKKILE